MHFIKRKLKGWAVRFNHEGEQHYLSGFRTKKEAEMAVLEFKKDNADKIDTDITVKEYLYKWFRNYSGEVSQETSDSYRYIIKTHIIPDLGDTKLCHLKPYQIQEFYTKLKNKEKSTGKKDDENTKISGTTALYVHRVLSLALKYSVIWEYSRSNPCQYVKAPSKEKPEIKVIAENDLQKVLSTSATKDYFIAIYICATTGMRISEVCGLQNKDIDLTNKRIYIRRSYKKSDTQINLKPTKTLRSNRPIAMLNGMDKVFKDYIKQKNINKMKYRNIYKNNDFFCTYCDGEPLRPEYVSKNFKKLIRKFGLDDDIDLKSLRHYHASWLLTRNIHPKIVSERLGHSSIKITLDTYSHLIPNLQQEILEKLDSSSFDVQLDFSIDNAQNMHKDN